MNRRQFAQAIVATFALTTGLAQSRLVVAMREAAPNIAKTGNRIIPPDELAREILRILDENLRILDEKMKEVEAQ